MLNLVDNALPWNVLFETGAVNRLPDNLDKLGFSRAMIVCTPGRRGQAAAIAALLGDRATGIFDRARSHVPIATVDAAIDMAGQSNADCCVSIGGGSTTGLGKALALKLNLPNIAIPTSYAGSEMTNIWGITEKGRKTTGRDNRVLPDLTIYDPQLTYGLPPRTSASSGMNALAQAAVNIVEPAAEPAVSAMALEAAELLANSLPIIVEQPTDVEARSDALRGACLAGAALGAGVTSLHHRLCHIIGGLFDTNHADTHAILLPHSIAFNSPAAPAEALRLAAAIKAGDAATGLYELALQINAPTSLSSLGLRPADLATVVSIAMEVPVNNPLPIEKEPLMSMLQNAHSGVPPQ